MLTNMMRATTLAALSLGLVACTETTSPSVCGDGESVQANGSSFCVYKEAIVIVGGFDCPASMPYRMDFERATVCSNHGFGDIDVPNDICARVFVPCTEEPVEVMEPDAGVFLCGATSCSFPNATARCVGDTRCEIEECAAGFSDCDGDSTNGCETSLDTLTNCGACGTTCSAGCCHEGVCGACPPVATCDAPPSGEPNYPFCSWRRLDCGGSAWIYDTTTYACECSKECDPQVASSCPAAQTGTATPECLRDVGGSQTALGGCHLTCDHGEACPSDMACVATRPNSFGARRICVWLSPAECPAACEPSAEICDRQDNDCDTLIDEDCVASVDDGGVCAPGLADCDANPANGCETSLTTVINCGACNNACVLPNAVASCASGACELATCNVGFDDCNATPSDGCESSLNRSDNCGACGNVCAELCIAGMCAIATD